MLRRALLATLLATPAAAREVRDATGRTVTLGDRLRRVVPAGPPAAILLHSLAPELMTGWPSAPPPASAAAFLPEEVLRLPGLPRLTGRDSAAGIDALLRDRPDLVLDYGSVAAPYVALAEDVQQRTGVPTLLLDGALARIPDTYRELGALLGRGPAAGRLAQAAEGILAAARPPASATRPRVLYLRGAVALDAPVAASSETLDLAGAEAIAGSATGTEQIRAWNPDWILATDPGFAAAAQGHPAWSALTAFREGRVRTVPASPFGWLDTPPSVNRLLGLIWLPVLFGRQPAGELAGRVGDFHTLFYHRRPEPAAIEALLRASAP
ncbi:ABC transporter substrate-binding protein [Roseococcus pinisoli]|uniref:ABC transporter substrate-binding protein n=1 Tax=Roseococcus pinisoli TaxID=2835040 RepID=A0ABS5QG16_9PROT|nr:ABC transporter substrate-binding protein [Roseococcus pinisoli]MBS7812443.1 ABC transporter substrate-binding protein [Roseococcus pinisoli]